MNATVLLIEPYYAGSHKQLMDLIHDELKTLSNLNVNLMTLPGKKWHWRARTSALYFAQNIPKIENLKCIFASCVLPLHELLGLRPDLHSAKKVVYFHENQLVYPVRKSKDRDFQYGYNQIMTCLAADLILFNSKFNQDSFLGNIKSFFKLQPDCRPKELRKQIEPKCQALYFPLNILGHPNFDDDTHCDKNVLKIVWPHRWEFDKNPDMLFRVLFALVEKGKTNFRINILGESFTDNPPIFEEAKTRLAPYIDHFGYVAKKEEYFRILHQSDIVLSTANHEFFGVAMLEAASFKCFPLAPNNLVYPEVFPFKKCLYTSEEDLLERLIFYLENRDAFIQDKESIFKDLSLEKFDWINLKSSYMDILIK